MDKPFATGCIMLLGINSDSVYNSHLTMGRRKRGLKPVKNAKEYNPDGQGFVAGNPGRPHGAKNLASVLRNKILSAAVKIDLEGFNLVQVKRKGKPVQVLRIKNVSDIELTKIGATLIPKESTVDLNVNKPMMIEVVHDYVPPSKEKSDAGTSGRKGSASKA